MPSSVMPVIVAPLIDRSVRSASVMVVPARVTLRRLQRARLTSSKDVPARRAFVTVDPVRSASAMVVPARVTLCRLQRARLTSSNDVPARLAFVNQDPARSAFPTNAGGSKR